MRLLLSSNAPWAQTGYGVQAKHMLRAWRDMGHKVACLAFWGLEGGQIEWEGIRIYGRHLDGYGNDAAPFAIRDFKADIIFTLIDLWVMDVNTGRHGAAWFPLFPIDSAPVAIAIAERFPHAHGLIVYSQFGKREVEKLGYQPTYIPHCVDCAAYHPCALEEKLAFRRKYYPDWPENAYIVGMVAANKGYPCRKSFPEALEAFALFAKEVPSARLYLHSYPLSHFGGPNLQELVTHFGVQDRVRILNPRLLLGGAYGDQMMRELYCTFDVFLNPAQGEGWAVPVVESLACGVPAVVTDFSAQAETCGVGWRVPPLRMIPTLQGNKIAEADVLGTAHALAESYHRLDDGCWQEMARAFALRYDVPTVVERYWKPFLKGLDAGRSELSLELAGLTAAGWRVYNTD